MLLIEATRLRFSGSVCLRGFRVKSLHCLVVLFLLLLPLRLGTIAITLAGTSIISICLCGSGLLIYTAADLESPILCQNQLTHRSCMLPSCSILNPPFMLEANQTDLKISNPFTPIPQSFPCPRTHVLAMYYITHITFMGDVHH